MSVAPPARRIQQAAAGALNTDVVMTDQQTTQQFLTLTRPNKLLNLVHETDPAAGLTYIAKIHRNGRETRRWFTSQLLTGFTGPVRPGFPVDLMQGQIQWVGQQLAGALTAINYIMVTLYDL
jgi:hypothetical protein